MLKALFILVLRPKVSLLLFFFSFIFNCFLLDYLFVFMLVKLETKLFIIMCYGIDEYELAFSVGCHIKTYQLYTYFTNTKQYYLKLRQGDKKREKLWPFSLTKIKTLNFFFIENFVLFLYFSF